MSHPPPPHPVTQRQVSGEETEDGEWLSTPRLRILENAGGRGEVRGSENVWSMGRWKVLGNPLQYLIKKPVCGRARHRVVLISIPRHLSSSVDQTFCVLPVPLNTRSSDFLHINFRKATLCDPNLFTATRCPSENTCAWASRSGRPPLPHSSVPLAPLRRSRRLIPALPPHPRHAQPAPNSGPRRGCGRERPKQEGGRRAGRPSSPWRSRRAEPRSGWRL